MTRQHNFELVLRRVARLARVNLRRQPEKVAELKEVVAKATAYQKDISCARQPQLKPFLKGFNRGTRRQMVAADKIAMRIACAAMLLESNRSEVKVEFAEAREALWNVADPLLLQTHFLGEQTGSGAAGMVYKAYRLPDNKTEQVRLVAVKLVGNPEAKVAELRGAAIQRTCKSSCVAGGIHPLIGSQPDHVAGFTMDLYPDGTLQDLIDHFARIVKHGERYGGADELGFVRDLLKGLAAAHASGIVHGDVKAANVLLAFGQGVKRAALSDFGIAKASGHRVRRGVDALGTPGHIAPELQDAEASDMRFWPSADMWSLGILLWDLLGGIVIERDGKLEAPVRHSAVRSLLQALCHACLNDDLAARPTAQFALQLVEDLLRELAATAHARRIRARRAATTPSTSPSETSPAQSRPGSGSGCRVSPSVYGSASSRLYASNGEEFYPLIGIHPVHTPVSMRLSVRLAYSDSPAQSSATGPKQRQGFWATCKAFKKRAAELNRQYKMYGYVIG